MLPTVKQLKNRIGKNIARGFDVGYELVKDDLSHYRCIGNDGAASSFIRMNHLWGFKFFYRDHFFFPRKDVRWNAYANYERSLTLQAEDLAPPTSEFIEYRMLDGTFRGYFQRICIPFADFCDRGGYSLDYDEENVSYFRCKLATLGFYRDIHESNFGYFQDKLVLFDVSHSCDYA